MTAQIAPNVYRIDVPLANSPLRNLNSYVVKGNGRNLIIDTGWNTKACKSALLSGLDELGVDMNETDIFLTHFHADHTGLAADIASDQSRIFIHDKDEPMWRGVNGQMTQRGDNHRNWMKNTYLEEGFPPEEFGRVMDSNPARAVASGKELRCINVIDGDIIQIGDYALTCVGTPGHTPGHMCLHMPQQDIMFLGDHVLYDITPNITVWLEMKNSLENFMSNLKKMKQYNCKHGLSAHRESRGDLNQRVDELLGVHEVRLGNVLNIIQKYGKLTAYQIASHMKWRINAKSWDEFPMHQKWFAVGEAIAHLYYLTDHGQVAKTNEQSVFWYTLPGL
jgi:glyoxylase-like metal-dependent hydrolase (beta-lactamase superfamily II)